MLLEDLKKVKRILILTTPFRPNVGGVETHLDDLISQATKKGWRFFVLTYQPLVTKAKGKTIEKGKGYIVYRIPWIRGGLFLKLEKYPILEFLYLFPTLFVFSFIFLLLKTSQISTIHAQGLVAGAIGVILGKIFNKPVIVSTHSIYNFPRSGLYPKFVRLLLLNCNRILTLSRQSMREIVGLGLPEKKVSIFTYWVNQNIFSPQNKTKAREILRLPKDKFICFFVGRLVGVKGVKELLSAAKITKEVTFVIAGDGPMENLVRSWERRLKNLIFVGSIENNRLPLYYNAADVLVVPSTHEEGFGRVILESLSCGTPVIGSRRGAIPEAMDDTVGIFIDVTPKKIKKALEDLRLNKRKVKELADNARKFARKHYSSRNITMITRYYV